MLCSFVYLTFQWIFLAASFAQPQNLPRDDRTADLVAIGQVIHLFPILVDEWRYDELYRVFSPKCTVNFGSPAPVLHGVPAVSKLLRELEGSTSQHALMTQYIDLIEPDVAQATTYVMAHFFDDAEEEAPNWTEYGSYKATLESTDDGWKIRNLTCVGLASFGHDPKIPVRPWGHHFKPIFAHQQEKISPSNRIQSYLSTAFVA